MKKWVWITIIIGIIVLAVVAFIVFKQVSTGKSIDYSAGSNIGEDMGKATDTNVFDSVKTNPFESGQNG